MFSILREFLGSRLFQSDEEVTDGVRTWLNELAAEVYDEGVEKLDPGCDNYLNVGGAFVENSLGSIVVIYLVYFNFYFVYFSL